MLLRSLGKSGRKTVRISENIIETAHQEVGSGCR